MCWTWFESNRVGRLTGKDYQNIEDVMLRKLSERFGNKGQSLASFLAKAVARWLSKVHRTTSSWRHDRTWNLKTPGSNSVVRRPKRTQN